MERKPPAYEEPKPSRWFGGFLSFGRWADISRIRWYFDSIFYYISLIFSPTQHQQTTSFEEVAKHSNLDDKTLEKQSRSFLLLAIFFSVACIGLLIYGIYEFTQGVLTAGILSTGISFYTLGLAFRYHFWHVQIKKRKLGCTFNDWLRYLIGK